MPTKEKDQTFFATNDPITIAQFDQEALLWHKAFKNAERKNRPVDYQGVFTFIGLIFSLVSSLIFLVIVLLGRFIKLIK